MKLIKKVLVVCIVLLGYEAYSCNKFDTINQTICPEDSFLFNGVYLKTAGTYYDTLNISPGCDTFKTLNLSVYPVIPLTFLSDSFCPRYSYTYNSKTYTTVGLFYDTLNSVNGCDSVIALALTYKNMPIVFPPPRGINIDTFCIRDTIYFESKSFKFTTGGLKTLRDTIYGGASNGCDSINLRVVFLRNNNGPSFVGNKYGCTNVPFVIGDSVFTTNGFKSVVLRNRFGCDSTIFFNLQRRPPSFTTLNRTTCSNQPFFFKGQFWGSGVTQDTLIVVIDTLLQTANAFGFGTQKCDSIITLNLTVYPIKFTSIDTSLCENHFYFFKGQNRNIPGVYKDTLKTYHNCDSFVTLTLLATRKTSSYTYYRKFCSNQTVYFNETNIDQAGTYNDTLVNAVGCDSFLTMVLTKDTAHNVTVNKSICSYDSFYFAGKYYVTAGTYMATFRNKDGCDSMVTLNLSIYPFKTVTLVRSTANNIKTDSGYKAYYWYFNEWTQLNVTGNTLAANTTGSYHVIAQDENNCRFKSNAYVHNPAGINENWNLGFQIYPNPTKDLIHIESLSSFDKNTLIYIFSMDGKLIFSQKSIPNSNRIIVDLNKVIPGLYMLRIESENNSKDIRIEKR
jgi:Secretion system C-terminal sorting domain